MPYTHRVPLLTTLTLQAIYDHAGTERGSLFPGSKDIYRSTIYRRGGDAEFDVLYSELDPSPSSAQ